MRSASLTVRIATIVLAAALASIVAYWALQVLAPRPAIAPATPTEAVGAVDPAPAARLFGGAAPAAPVAPPPSNMQVAGVVASGRQAAAVLSIDGQPARAYGVGMTLPGGARVVEVRAERVVIDRDGTRIELPAPTRPSVALLTSGPRAGQSTGAPAAAAGAPTSSAFGSAAVPGAAAPAAGGLAPLAPPPGLSVPPAAGAALPAIGTPAPAGMGAATAPPGQPPGGGPRGTVLPTPAH